MLFFKKKPTAAIQLFNTKGREKQVFEPLRAGVVKLYSCGPTVYDYVHIGNLRSFVFSDIVRRTFEYAGYKVQQVINITDLGHLVGDGDEGDDKMTAGLKREGIELSLEGMKKLADKYSDAFKEDLNELNIQMPHALPRASEHVRGQIAYIETLLHKEYAYKTSDGVYFDTEKFSQYGELGGSASEEHSRIGVSEEKKNQKDFALWKFDDEFGWEAPWGKGFPGWHIECTAMATRYLGKSFDIHTGGIDLRATHHNNEIAQAEAANGKPYVRYWLHHEFINIDSAKISKSLGNTITLRQLADKGISGVAYRYWLLTGHYRQQMNFTWEAVEAAQTALHRALKFFADLPRGGAVNEVYRKRFEAALFDDFNTPEAVAVMWELIKDEAVKPEDKRRTIVHFDQALGLGFATTKKNVEKLSVISENEVPEEVRALSRQREEARKAGEWGRADALRDELKEKGFQVEDTPKGPVLHRVES